MTVIDDEDTVRVNSKDDITMLNADDGKDNDNANRDDIHTYNVQTPSVDANHGFRVISKQHGTSFENLL